MSIYFTSGEYVVLHNLTVYILPLGYKKYILHNLAVYIIYEYEYVVPHIAKISLPQRYID